jgi:hypothetical protein
MSGSADAPAHEEFVEAFVDFVRGFGLLDAITILQRMPEPRIRAIPDITYGDVGASARSRGTMSSANWVRKRSWSWPGPWNTRWFRPTSR